jgi:hypothetical protein
MLFTSGDMQINLHLKWYFVAQIENEYGPEGKEFGAAGQAYINWAAKIQNLKRRGGCAWPGLRRVPAAALPDLCSYSILSGQYILRFLCIYKTSLRLPWLGY